MVARLESGYPATSRRCYGGVCSSSRTHYACTAYAMTIGDSAGLDPESFIHSKYIILWACNTLSTNTHHWPFIEKARKNGAKLVNFAETWIPGYPIWAWVGPVANSMQYVIPYNENSLEIDSDEFNSIPL